MMSGRDDDRSDITIALVGNVNVGKSAIFNQLTGLEQIVGNYPDKTVVSAEGRLVHDDVEIRLVDLPGIFSLSVSPGDEVYRKHILSTADFILSGEADVMINVVDATALERNLYLTIQLLEADIPMILGLNLVDQAKKKGIRIDIKALSKALGIPVLEVVAVHGTGVHELVDAAIDAAMEEHVRPRSLRYGKDLGKMISALSVMIAKADPALPARWAAIQMLEGGPDTARFWEDRVPGITAMADSFKSECERTRSEPCHTVIASERYALAGRITNQCQQISSDRKLKGADRIDAVAMHPFWGYVILLGTMIGILAFISIFGSMVAGWIEDGIESFNPHRSGFWWELFWSGGVVGLYASLGVALGFLLPFYLILSVLENSGYLPRISFLMDRPCHAVGLHGKAVIPIVTAFGCNVPACVGCRIIGDRRDRIIATVLSTLVPCSARTAVILGIVGIFMGPLWAILVYLLDFVIIIVIGRIMNRLMKGGSSGLVLEIPSYRVPGVGLLWDQAWSRFRPFLFSAVPFIIAGSIAIELLRLLNTLDDITHFMRPVTVWWLGLPSFTIILLLLGILRKEATVVLLATVAGTTAVHTVMTPVQMFVFVLVITLYIPCIATIGVLIKEMGWRIAVTITLGEIILAFLVGGIAYRVLSLVM
jgi:ferrous iron transport protein B